MPDLGQGCATGKSAVDTAPADALVLFRGHGGLGARKISSRTSVDSFFLPTRFLAFEIKLQYSRNPARCQRTTVSGVTTSRDFFHSDQNRHASIQKSLSKGKSVGLSCLRFSTASC